MNDEFLSKIPDLLDQTDRDIEEMSQLDESLLCQQISHPSPVPSEVSHTVLQSESQPYDDSQLHGASVHPEADIQRYGGSGQADAKGSQQPESFQPPHFPHEPQYARHQPGQTEPAQDPASVTGPSSALNSHPSRRRGPRQCRDCGAAPPYPHRRTCHHHPHNGGTGRGGRVFDARRGGRRRRGGHVEINTNGHVTVRAPVRQGSSRSGRGNPHFSFSVRHGRVILSSTDANGNLTQWFY